MSSSAVCAYVVPLDALIIGGLAGLAAILTNEALATFARFDDPVGAIGVHGVGGICGLIAVAFCTDNSLPGVDVRHSGLLHGGGGELLKIQCLGIVVVIAWAIVTMVPFFFFLGLGLDWVDHRLHLSCPRSQATGSRWRVNSQRGLRYDCKRGMQLDPVLHGCSEDPADLIREEIAKALSRYEARRRRQLAPVIRTLDPSSNPTLQTLPRQSLLVFAELKKMFETALIEDGSDDENESTKSTDDSDNDTNRNDGNNCNNRRITTGTHPVADTNGNDGNNHNSQRITTSSITTGTLLVGRRKTIDSLDDHNNGSNRSTQLNEEDSAFVKWA